MDDIFFNKYMKYKQKYIQLKTENSFARSNSFKQKYIALKAQSIFAQSDSLEDNHSYINQLGGRNKTYYISSSFKINKEFIENFKLLLKKKKYIESSEVPINFVFIYNSVDRKNFLSNINNDFKKSQLINIISGKSYEGLINNILFTNKYKNNFFIHPYQEIDINNIKDINKSYILDPKFTYGSSDINRWLENPRSLVSSKKEIEEIIRKNPQYKEWIIKDELTEPTLKNGRKITLNLLFLVKVKPLRIYFYKKKLYTLPKKLYDKDTFYTDGYVREPYPYHIYNRDISFEENNIARDILFFPDSYPDNWTKRETLEMDEMINSIIPIIFQSNINFETVYNSKNGYEILNATVDLYERLGPIVHGIFTDWYPFLHRNILPGLISILIDNKDHKDFQRVSLKEKIKSISTINNYKFERYFSYGRSLPPTTIDKTFYVKMQETDFEEELIGYLIKQEYKKEFNFPVDFILLSGHPSHYRHRFDSKGSNWISLLYGNSKTEITNKILLHKKYKDFDFIISANYLSRNKPIPDIDEKTIKILKPLNGFSGSGIKVLQTKSEIESWLKESDNERYKEWLLEDYIVDPDLKDGHKFHFRVLVLVKVIKNKPIEVFISEHKFFVKALEKYQKGDWNNKDIHDTHYKAMKYDTFPQHLPDGWSIQDGESAIKKMNQIVTKIFTNQNDFKPDWNAKNGFEIFGTDFIFSKKQTYLLEINAKTGIKGCNIVIPGIVDTILEGKENKYFTKLI